MYGWKIKKQIDDISNRQVSMIMKEKDISIKSLPGYANIGLKTKDLKPYEKSDKCSIKLKDQYVTFLKTYLVISL